MNKSVRKIFDITGTIIFSSVIIISILLIFFIVKSKLNNETPNIAGNRVYIVLSGSMSPTFDTGSAVIVRDIQPDKIQANDIITFKDPRDNSRIITHRVIEVKKENGSIHFITKGDANNAKDSSPVPVGNVIGKARIFVPHVGYFMESLRSKKTILILIVIPGAIIFIKQLLKFIRTLKEENEAGISDEQNSENSSIDIQEK